MSDRVPHCAFYHERRLREPEESRNLRDGVQLEEETQDEYMTIVCVTILDYSLYLTTLKTIQNFIQGGRWDFYEGKILQLFDCVGYELAGGSGAEWCKSYSKLASG